MNNNLKIFLKISSKTFIKWLFLFFAGQFITIIFLCIVILTLDDIGGGGGHALGGGGAALILLPIIIIPLLAALFFYNFFAFLLVAGVPVFITLYTYAASIISIQYAIYQIWKNKTEGIIEDRAKKIIAKIIEGGHWTESISDAKTLRSKLTKANKEDKEDSKFKRKLVSYIFKKIKLDDIDYKDVNLNLSDIIMQKINGFAGEMGKPTLFFFKVVFFIQLGIFICSLLFPGILRSFIDLE